MLNIKVSFISNFASKNEKKYRSLYFFIVVYISTFFVETDFVGE